VLLTGINVYIYIYIYMTGINIYIYIYIYITLLLNRTGYINSRDINRDSIRWTHRHYLLKLVIPTTNSLPRWRLNVETKTKRGLHGSRRLSFNELMNAKKFWCCKVMLLSTDAAATAVRYASALAVAFESLGLPLSNVM
jgi:hypothetical protein